MSDRDAHALLAPSSAHIWGADDGCRASVSMQRRYPQPADSPEAAEGTAAHFYVTELLEGRDVPVGSVAPNGHPITAEMVDCAQAILIDVRDTMLANPGGELRVERRVFMHNSVSPENDGTPDVVYVIPALRKLWEWDYKFGHRFVDAAGNWQLIDYALGVLEGLGCSLESPASYSGWQVVLTIAQPRNYSPVGPMREWFTTGETIRDYGLRMRAAAAECLVPAPMYRSGDHCLDCTAAHACPVLQRSAAIGMDVSMRAQPVDLPPHAIGLELRLLNEAAARIKARQTGLEEHALALIRGGTLVPHFTVEPTSGRERWVTPVAEVFAMGDMLGVETRKPPEPITPGQARKAGLDAKLVAAYAETPRGALRLKRVNDNDAKLAFG